MIVAESVKPDSTAGVETAGRNFEGLFRELTGREPYPWQGRLYACFTAAKRPVIPDALDLPTGLGKTSVLAVWLCARIAGAALPRRLIYTVDRRAVVDQATEEAEALAANLDRLIAAPGGEAIACALGLEAERPTAPGEARLPISTLRGQRRDNRRWFADPAGSAIVIGTVDMVGSRLLFSGYGVSRGMRPFHAGLIGFDALLVVDEAHLAPAFEGLLREAAAMIGEDGRDLPLPPPVRVLGLSATGRERTGADVFRLEPQDWKDERTAARLRAPKALHVAEPRPASGLAKALADQAWALRADEWGAARRVVVFCNSRKTAQDVEGDLARRVRGKEGYGKDRRLTALLVGERRRLEREALAADPLFRRFLGGDKAAPGAPGEPAFLVATSAGEVGVDLDADDLVCDLVAFERMVQRFGRVNRRAEPGLARLHVLPVADDKEAEDPVGAEDLHRLLAPFRSPAWPRVDEGGALQASPEALLQVRAHPELAGAVAVATTPEPLRPPLTREAVDAWSLTSLKDHPGRPKVGPWLRGWVDSEPQTQVVWRRWLPLAKGAPRLTAALSSYLEEYARPHASEVLEAPSWRVAKLLVDRARALGKAGKDAAGVGRDDDPDGGGEAEVLDEGGRRPLHPPVVVRLDSEGAVEGLYDLAALTDPRLKPDALARQIASGTVVVDARIGGLDVNGLLDSSEPERAGADGRIGTASDLRAPLAPESGADPAMAHVAMPGWWIGVDDEDPNGEAKDSLWRASGWSWRAGDEAGALSLRVWLWRGGGPESGDPALSRTAQPLAAHHADAEAVARRIAGGLQLAPEHADLLAAAARGHDLGKARRAWQDVMRAPRDAERPYAKTMGGGDWRALNGYRHEFGSILDILAEPDKHLAEVADPALRELAIHLVAAHHGHARPTIKAYDPERLPTLSEPRARAVALRFAALQARWGPWGLAWWEALLRAADQAASCELDLRGGELRG